MCYRCTRVLPLLLSGLFAKVTCGVLQGSCVVVDSMTILLTPFNDVFKSIVRRVVRDCSIQCCNCFHEMILNVLSEYFLHFSRKSSNSPHQLNSNQVFETYVKFSNFLDALGLIRAVIFLPPKEGHRPSFQLVKLITHHLTNRLILSDSNFLYR